MINDVDKHYEMVVHQAYQLGLSGGGTPKEYDEVLTRQLAKGRNLVAVMAEPRSYKTHVHYSLRDMFARAASHAYFATRRQRATLDTTRDFEVAFGLGFDEGERIYSTPETARAATMPAEDPAAEQSTLMIAANLLMGMGHIDYGRAVRSLARKLGKPVTGQGAAA